MPVRDKGYGGVRCGYIEERIGGGANRCGWRGGIDLWEAVRGVNGKMSVFLRYSMFGTLLVLMIIYDCEYVLALEGVGKSEYTTVHAHCLDP